MAMLIVGGDRVERLRQAMEERGLGPVDHWNGRKPGYLHRALPRGLDLVVVVWNQVNHPLLRKVREEAGRLGIPVLYTRHSPSARGEALAAAGAEIVDLAERWLGSGVPEQRAAG